MAKLRGALRLAACGGVTLIVLLWLAVVWILAFGPLRLRRALQRATFKLWGRAVCRILSVRVEIIGDPPRPPCLLVANHLSYLDIPVIATVVPARFVARADVRDWPLVGWACRLVETFFIDRSSRSDAHRVTREMSRGLEAGDAIVFFPEGTSSSGYTVEPFRAPLLAPAAELDLPVHHVALHYATGANDPPAHLAVSWWGEMTLAPHVRQLLTLSQIRATLRFGDRPLHDPDRKALARKLRAGVLSEFVPVVDFEPEDPSLAG